jgi:hypothetical protein
VNAHDRALSVNSVLLQKAVPFLDFFGRKLKARLNVGGIKAMPFKRIKVARDGVDVFSPAQRNAPAFSANKARPETISQVNDQIEPLAAQFLDEPNLTAQTGVFPTIIVGDDLVDLRVACEERECANADKKGNLRIRESFSQRSNDHCGKRRVADEGKTKHKNSLNHAGCLH